MSDVRELVDNHSRTKVGEDELVSGWKVAVIVTGICITLPSLITGGEAAQNLGLMGAIWAIVLASITLGIMAVPSSIVGARTRFTSYMILEFVFGQKGAKAVNFLLGLTLVGWFTVTAGFFGQILAEALLHYYDLTMSVPLLTFLSSVLIIITTIFGFKAIDRMALFAVPFLVIILLMGVTASLENTNLSTVINIEGSNPSFFLTAVSAVVGSLIFNVVAMPDLSRYAKTDKDAMIAAVGGNCVGNIISMLAATIPVLVVGVLDPVGWMYALGLSWAAVFVLIFATWTTNSVNLYSSALVAATITPNMKDWQITIAIGLIGTGLAMSGVTDHFIEFLVFLGVIVPPVAGVYLSDYFILKRQNYQLEELAKRAPYHWVPLAAWIISTSLSVWAFWVDVSLSGVQAIDAFLLTIPLYLMMDKMFHKDKAEEGASCE